MTAETQKPNKYLSTAVGIGTGILGAASLVRPGAMLGAKLGAKTFMSKNPKSLEHLVSQGVVGGIIGAGAGAGLGAGVGAVAGYQAGKKGTNKYLEKAALHSVHKWGIGGAAVGSLLGLKTQGNIYDEHEGKIINRKFTTGERIKNSLAGGIFGGYAGLTIGTVRHARMSGQYRGHGGEAPPPRYKTRSMKDIYSDLGAKPGTFRNKSEASRHYKKMAMKHHPDRPGGSVDTMKKVNTAWDDFKKHPDGFEKLAGLGILERIYER